MRSFLAPLSISALSLTPLWVSAANLGNWEGSHIDVPSSDSRSIDWWYTQVIGQTPTSNGLPPSLEVVFKHGNPFQFGTSNTPLYLFDMDGYDNDGQVFSLSLSFNSSSVNTNKKGETIGKWDGDLGHAGFIVSADLKNFTMVFDTKNVTGTVVILSNAHFRTGCGSEERGASPFFENLVADGRELSPSEDIMYKQTGWRITAPGGNSVVDLNINNKGVKFLGAGYKDSNWAPAALNDFIRSWYVIIAQVGPYNLVTFSGQAKEGKNLLNSAHLIKDGKYLTSSCSVIGEHDKDISIITPSGETSEFGLIAPTGFDIKFILADGKEVNFHAENIVEHPAVSVYHRWIAKYTGGAEGENFESFGLTEWMNPAALPKYELIQ
ncbi:hypothetical protein DL96DRAFT_1638111 [Flagelloscypha sp. PMI_526]|nr:hypothetical protein DL96DRAFT_1638111 [Flagelloscypha sp. PMI_526]